MFKRAGAVAEKALLLDPASRNNLADGTHRVPPLLGQVGQADPSGVKRSLSCSLRMLFEGTPCRVHYYSPTVRWLGTELLSDHTPCTKTIPR